jgi:uncharacterized protein YndB with AHSA1/START domain
VCLRRVRSAPAAVNSRRTSVGSKAMPSTSERNSMIRAESSVDVPRSAEDVFAFLADGTNNTRWRSGVHEIRHIRGRGGAEYEQLLTGPGGRTMRANYRVVASEEPTRLEFEVTAGPARPRGSFTITLSHRPPAGSRLR